MLIQRFDLIELIYASDDNPLKYGLFLGINGDSVKVLYKNGNIKKCNKNSIVKVKCNQELRKKLFEIV
jgi:hypothetical protein